MRVYRMTIEALEGAPTEPLATLYDQVREIGGMHIYGPDDAEPWGKALTAGAFNFDFDLDNETETGGDSIAMELVTAFVETRGS